MKLYDCKTAPSPRRVRIFAAEKGLDIELVPVDLGSGEQFGEAFRAVNPDCVVPVLELDDGSRLSEVFAICQYLEEVHPQPPLFGSSPVARAEATMWNSKVEQQGLMAMAEAFRNSVPGLKGHAVTGSENYEQIPALAERGRRRVAAFFARMDTRLGEHEFVAGDRYTIADITLLVTADFALRMKFGLGDGNNKLQRWYDSVAARPSATA